MARAAVLPVPVSPHSGDRQKTTLSVVILPFSIRCESRRVATYGEVPKYQWRLLRLSFRKPGGRDRRTR
jgi:hypothetical protein